MNDYYLKRNNRGVWEIRWTENGRSRRKSTRTKNTAQAEQALSRHIVGAKVTVETVPEALDQYRQRNGADRDAARESIICHWLKQHFKGHVVGHLSERDVEQYVDKRRAGAIGTKPAADSTIRRELGLLQAALNYCVRIKALPAEYVPDIPKPTAEQDEIEYLTREQVDALLTFLLAEDKGKRMSRVHRFIVIGLATGARKRAIETLEWSHVRLPVNRIRFDLQVRQQTKKRRVPVPIASWLRPYLQRMLDERIEDGYLGRFVLDHDGDIRAAFDAAMKRVAKATGDDTYRRLTRHGLRHTCATLALQSGADLWQVAGLLGDNPQTVAKTYGHHIPDHVKKAAEWR